MAARYLFIFEDGTLSVADEIPDCVIVGCDDGIYDIVDMKTRKQYAGNDTWVGIANIDATT